jgi:inhibitor of KinA sporulation pathway (predicted exonuclease)
MNQQPAKKFFYALDLEMEQPSDEIISIGVAYQHVDYDEEVDLESRTVTYIPKGTIERRNFLITPSQPLSPFIQELTGLKDEMFDWTKSRKQCFQEFLEAHEQQNTFLGNMMENAVLHGEAITWGCGDIALLRKQIEDCGIFLDKGCRVNRRFIDVKSLVMLHRKFLGKSISGRMGLKSGLGEFGLLFVGDAHDSSWDAYNTLVLFEAYCKKMQAMYDLIGLAKEI